jgi:hydroxymethylbilane synthase
VRLGLLDDRCRPLTTDCMLPAVGQGAIGVECRIADTAINALLEPLDDPATASCVRAERAMNAALGGSCTVPVAGHAWLAGETLRLIGLVTGVDGRDVVRQTASGPVAEAERIGTGLGEELLAAGAARILRELNEQ